jgi:hypothetical protein
MKRYLVFALMLAAWMLSCRAEAQEYPTMRDMPVYVGVGYNAFGDRILLTANLCAGENDARDHMHFYQVVDAHGNMLTGGCWQMRDTIKTDTVIHFFSLNGGGWGTWPKSAFHKPRYPQGTQQ